MGALPSNIAERGTYIAPAVVASLSITQKAFWRLFTTAEREAMHNIISTGTQAQKNKINAFRDYIIQGGNVELNDDYVIASVALLETAGVLAAGRGAVVLSTTISNSERP